MRVQVKLFALARQLAGEETAAVDLPPSATVRDLKATLAERYPPLADLLRHTRFAINADYASDATPVPADAEIACIPPVSGG